MVVLIIAIVAGILVPAYNRFYAHYRFGNMVEKVETIMEWTHRKAIQLDAPLTLQFNGQQEVFEVQLPAPLPAQDEPVALQASDAQAQQSVEVTRTLHISGNYKVMNFQLDGSPSNSGLISLTFHGDGTATGATFQIVSKTGETETLSLSPTTGEVRVEQNNE